MIPIRYIGHRDTYIEGVYGSRIEFVKGGVQNVADELAAKLLKHPDVYEQAGDAEEADGLGIQKPVTDEPDDLIESARDMVANMNKAALEEFAQTNFRMTISKTGKLADLRNEVIGMIDQFGLPK